VCAEAEYGHTFQRLKGAFRIASPLIKPINSIGLFRLLWNIRDQGLPTPT